MSPTRVAITGAGGFIGHHLVGFLKQRGYWVRGVDMVAPAYESSAADEFLRVDLRVQDHALEATRDVDEVYALAADMGGVGYISMNHSRLMRNNLLIALHSLQGSSQNRVHRYLFSSSACVYPVDRQAEANVTPLREEEAYPAQPGDGYGWEKLTTERLCGYYGEEHGVEMRIARFHNIFGPMGAWDGGREKAPAAICRKVAIAKLTGSPEIEIWGDGEQTRSFCYIDDCLEGVHRLMRSDYREPLNLGQDRQVTINQLADIVADIAGIRIVKRHLPGPQGVRGRNSDNTRVQRTLGWQPRISLEEGLARTYAWIEARVRETAGPGLAARPPRS